MQASGKFTISIHICLYLQFKEGALASSQQIAHSVQTNPVVIRRLVKYLREHNIVGSIAGAKGGFFLNRPADQLSLWEIYNAVKDQDLFYVPKSNDECPVGYNLIGLVDEVYKKAEMSMESVLGKITISDLNSKLSEKLVLQEDKFC